MNLMHEPTSCSQELINHVVKCYTLKGVLIVNSLNNTLASCSLININFLPLPIEHFEKKNIVFTLLVFENCAFTLCILSALQAI